MLLNKECKKESTTQSTHVQLYFYIKLFKPLISKIVPSNDAFYTKASNLEHFPMTELNKRQVGHKNHSSLFQDVSFCLGQAWKGRHCVTLPSQ